MCAPSTTDSAVFDLIGLGFGPANIAIAAALTEAWSAPNSSECPIKNVLFLEKHDKFCWHPGMLLPDARMQISFMKDLATLRSPQSPYTFLSYLHSQNRLINFINRGSTIPTRKEYADYLTWAAQRVQDNGAKVKFGHHAIGLNDGKDNTIEVHVRNLATGEEQILWTRDLIISPGGSAKVPTVMLPHVNHPKVAHSSSYCLSVGSILEDLAKQSRPLRVAVIGSGQSAAEVTLDLRQRLGAIAAPGGRHEVEMLIRKGSLKPSDDSPFANEIFDPASTDAWFNMPSNHIRASTLSEYKSTNYGVVNPRTIEALYEIIYDQKLDVAISERNGVQPEALQPVINILPYTSIASVDLTRASSERSVDLLLSTESSKPQGRESFLITSQHSITRAVSDRQYDAIIYATGYQRTLWADLLKNAEIGKHFGLSASSSDVQLTPSTKDTPTRIQNASPLDSINMRGSLSPVSRSADSTPPTSPEPSMFGSMQLKRPSSKEVRISRSYRLLPVTEGEKVFEPRVYLQGVEEASHGLSDTLLSVLGVRAGEVVADLINGRRV